ncbi:MAG: glycosyltransferase family 2 protein [Lachnospiraceae bacterium]|nr:glycosyltransferase family 2 protein [Lachnospiraceae bacterium]
MRLCIDSAFVRDGKLNIIGWGAGDEASHIIEYTASDSKGKELECRIFRNVRPDIGYALFRDPGKDDLGMYIEIPYEKGKTVTLRARETGTDGTVYAEEKYPLNPAILKLREKAKAGKEIYLNLRHKAGRIVNKLIKRNDRKYAAWFQAFRASAPELSLQAEKQKHFKIRPKFSILVPVYRTKLPFLHDMIRSVLHQSYPLFELVIVNASPEDQALSEALLDWQAADPRIIVQDLPENKGIAENTNAALSYSSGDFICMLDHDDMIEPDALFCYAKYLNEHPETDVFYSDEDKITEKSDYFFFPHFKSDFNIDMLRCNNYMCHFLAVRKSLACEVKGWRTDYDGAQDFDFILRLIEKTENICHIPRILYHWRSYGQSTAQAQENKSYAIDAGARAINAHYERIGYRAHAVPGAVGGWYISKYELAENPLVSVLIPNKDHTDDLEVCLKSLYEKCSYKNFEVIVIENNSTEEETFRYYKEAEKKYPRLKVVTWESGFNFSAINNFGLTFAEGEYILLLNNDVEVITPDLFEGMLGYCMRSEVGAVGVKLLYADDTIQHAGVLLGAGGLATHSFKGKADSDPCYMCRAITDQDVSAVTAACLMVKRSVYEEVGGLDESFEVAFNDVDFCLKIREKGYLIVYNAQVKLHHYESKSRGTENTPEKFIRFSKESKNLNEKWGINRYDRSDPFTDPYYNPNLSYMDYFNPDYRAVPARNEEVKEQYRRMAEQ